MRALIIAWIILTSAPLAGAEECPTVRGQTLPCSSAQQSLPEVQGIPPMLPDPLFTAEQVARDTSPEFLALLNDPTWEHAIRAAQVDLYRVYRGMVAIRLKEAARAAIVADMERQTGLSIKTDFLAFLEQAARRWGMPTTELPGTPSPSVGDQAEMARALADAIMKGTP